MCVCVVVHSLIVICSVSVGTHGFYPIKGFSTLKSCVVSFLFLSVFACTHSVFDSVVVEFSFFISNWY